MFQSPDSRKDTSLMLSEVLDDIGVNDRMRMKANRVYNLMPTMNNIMYKSVGNSNFFYNLGSKIEGTTTLGLKSDLDVLVFVTSFNVIQDLSEWEHGKENYFMVQDHNTTPGYCMLLLLQHDTALSDECYISDRKGRKLLKNKLYGIDNLKNYTQHGPSMVIPRELGFNHTDRVFAYPCKSWPKSAVSGWLERQGVGKWPTQEMRRYAVSTPCCVVRTGSKVSEYPELEWRISTCLAERCLMFDLNMTQIKCYVLMKMILKSFLNPQGEINISSFMCKTILFHCIEQKEPSIWKESNLLECLKVCLVKLSSCVQNNNLSHFFIPENNLIAGQFTFKTTHQLLENISDFIQYDVQRLLTIDIDDLGQRLQVKLNLEPKRQYNLNSSHHICGVVSACMYISMLIHCGNNLNFHSDQLHNKEIGIMKQSVERLMTFNNNNNKLVHVAFTFHAPFLCSTYGSALASESIGAKNQVSPQALAWLLNGFESDVSSGRLKLASVFYSSGDMDKAEMILRQTKRHFISDFVCPICTCWYPMPQILSSAIPAEVLRVCYENNEDCVKYFAAFCVRFLRQEINCVPRELQYEMFRSTHDDMKHRDQDEGFWMDWAVVDSHFLLYFLQYKIYRHHHRHKDQQKAINKLANIIKTDETLRHKETALNVLGQCMEQENRPKQAIQCYLFSLKHRARNNVAKIHICRLLNLLMGIHVNSLPKRGLLVIFSKIFKGYDHKLKKSPFF